MFLFVSVKGSAGYPKPVSATGPRSKIQSRCWTRMLVT